MSSDRAAHRGESAAEVVEEIRERHAVLLACLLAAFVVEGIVPRGPWERGAVTLLLSGTLLLAFAAAQMTRRRLHIATAVVAIGIGVVLVSLLAGESKIAHGASALANTLLIALAPPAVVLGVMRTLRIRRQVTIDVVFGVLCLYLLIGMLFAFIYQAIDNFSGQAAFANGLEANPSRALYFSFATLTTVGYGDLSLRTDLGHTLSVLEALIGQIYLVTVVAVIVANLTPRQLARH